MDAKISSPYPSKKWPGLLFFWPNFQIDYYISTFINFNLYVEYERQCKDVRVKDKEFQRIFCTGNTKEKI